MNSQPKLPKANPRARAVEKAPRDTFHRRVDRARAGKVHHIAWASKDAEHPRRRARVVQTGAGVTDVIDRDYFYSIYVPRHTGLWGAHS